MTRALKVAMARALWAIVGRRNLVRLARFLLNEGRLDVPNRISSNGELAVQRAVLGAAAGGGEGRLVVFDVGAHRGEWSGPLLGQAGRQETRVELHAFEPSRETFSLLSRELLGAAPITATVQVMPIGLSDRSGRAILHVPHPLAGTSSLHRSVGSEPTYEESIELTTVQAYCAERGIARVNLLKVDAEGHDLAVLRGALPMLEIGAIDVVQFEYNHRWILARRYLLDAFELLAPLGYTIGKVTPRGVELYEGWDPELESFREGNYVALTREWVKRVPTLRWWGP